MTPARLALRDAVPADALAIAQVQVASWQAAYRHLLPAAWLSAMSVPARCEQWRRVLSAAHAVAVTCVDGQVAGFVSAGPSRDPGAPAGTHEVYALYVHPDAWSQGHGGALLDWARATCRARGGNRLTLWALVGNERGSRFYERQGLVAETDARRAVDIADTQLFEDRFVDRAPRPRVGVGVGVLVVHDSLVLLGRRRGSHGAGTWSAPGGALEFGEQIVDCAARELREETGLQAGSFELGPYTNDVFAAARRHDLTVFVVARGITGTPVNREPHKCEGWAWFRWGQWPEPLFGPLRSLLAIGWQPVGTS